MIKIQHRLWVLCLFVILLASCQKTSSDLNITGIETREEGNSSLQTASTENQITETNDWLLPVLHQYTLNKKKKDNSTQTVVNQAPVACFTTSVTSGYAPLTLDINASCSNDPDGSIVDYLWSIKNARFTEKSRSITLDTEGTWVIKLTVTDDKGLIHSTQKNISVLKATHNPEYPTNTDGTTTVTLTFPNDSSDDPTGSNVEEEVIVSIVDGSLRYQGDIVVGEINTRNNNSLSTQALFHSSLATRWPNRIIPFEIDSSIIDQASILRARDHWNNSTNIELVEYTNQPDYITFRNGNDCSSRVGRQGGQQFINLATNCDYGAVVHEIGHAVGLWHEQSRSDRNNFMNTNLDNIIQERRHNFATRDTHIRIDAYDFDSIMHYSNNFPADWLIDSSIQTQVFTPINNSIDISRIGQRNGLSIGDIRAVNQMYPIQPSINSFTAIPTAIASGQSTNLTWTLSGSEPITLSINKNVGIVNGISQTVSPIQTTTYTLTASNSAGSDSAQITVSVTPQVVAASINSFTASPTTITAGESTRLNWDVSGTSPTIEISGRGTVTGNSITVSPTRTTTYTLTATNAEDSVSRQVTVQVLPQVVAPSINSFTASPQTITAGQQTRLSWNVSGTSPTIQISGRGTVTGNSVTVSPTRTTTYTLTATNAEDSASRQVTVQVLPQVVAPRINSFTASPQTITAGESTRLSWSISGTSPTVTIDGIGTVSGTSRTVSPSRTTSYTLTVRNSDGRTVSQQIPVIVLQPQPAELAISNTQGFTITHQDDQNGNRIIGIPKSYTVTNRGEDSMQVSVNTNAYWLSVLDSSFTLRGGESRTIRMNLIESRVETASAGTYNVTFTNRTNNRGTTSIQATLNTQRVKFVDLRLNDDDLYVTGNVGGYLSSSSISVENRGNNRAVFRIFDRNNRDVSISFGRSFYALDSGERITIRLSFGSPQRCNQPVSQTLNNYYQIRTESPYNIVKPIDYHIICR